MATPHSIDQKPTLYTSNPTMAAVYPGQVDPESRVFKDKTCGARCSRFIGRFPAIICVSCLILLIGLSVPYKDAPGKMAGTSNNDWTVIMPPTDVNDMWNNARERTSPADPSRITKPRSNMNTGRGAITYLYAWDEKATDSAADIFTPTTLQEMCELERYFVDDPEYATTFCPLTYSNNSNVADGCAAQRLSAPRLFYAATFIKHDLECPLPSTVPDRATKCSATVAKMRQMIEAPLYPIVATNPTDNVKYYVAAMPGTPSTLFNFTSFTRAVPENGGYQLTGTEACPLLPEWHIAAVKDWLYTTVALDQITLGSSRITGEQLLGFFMDKNTLQNTKTTRTRSMIYMGSPLSGYVDLNDNKEEQKELYTTYMMAGEPKLFQQFGMKETNTLGIAEQTLAKSPYRENPTTEGNMAVDWYSSAMNSNEFSRMLGGDFAMVAFSIIFVWIWIQIHVWSPLIGGLGMLQILLSIPVTYTIYTIFVPYYSQMHILAVFLVLGVGADDVFVMTDGWKQSVRDVVPVPGESKNERLIRRMTYAYGRTASAVFNTSFTTAMAFVSTAISPIMTISAFGTYAALAIVVNYIMVITWFPAVILTAEMYIWPTFGLKWGPQDEDVWTDELAYLGEGVESVPETQSWVDNVVENYYAKAMMYYVKEIQIRGTKDDELSGQCCDRCRLRPVATSCLVVIATWASVMIWQMSTLEPPSKAEAFFPADHMSTGIVDLMSEEYLGAGSASYQKAAVVFGLKDLDRSKFDRYNPDYDRGIVGFDDAFDIYTTANQLFLVDVCTQLENQICRVGNKDGGDYLEACTGQSHKLVRASTLNCWIRDFHAWHVAEYKGVEAFNNNLVTEDVFLARLMKFRKEEKPPEGRAASTYKDAIGVIAESKKIRYVSFQFTSTMVSRKPVGVKQPLYDMMEVIVSEMVEQAPAGLKYIDQDFGFRGWVWMETEKALVNGLFNGLYICFPIAFAVLAVATKNLPLALVATLSIGCIVASVLGFVKAFNGWDLGIAETIAGIIVIGFSVDYVVHMGHMYIEAAEKSGAMTRESRFYYAASKMGSTVMAGAVTTAGSGAFMFMCQMRFFYKMAVLITLTIGFSFVFSFGFFMAYLITIGPEFDNGNLSFLCGGSLVQHAKHAVAERKQSLANWKSMRKKGIQTNGPTMPKNSKNSTKSTTTGKDAIEMITTNGGEQDKDTQGAKEELSGNEIMNWGNKEEEEEANKEANTTNTTTTADVAI